MNTSIPVSRFDVVIPYGRQTISEADIAAVTAALRADLLTTGPTVAEFEQRFAEAVGARHAVAVNSATAALHLAMAVLELGSGDRVVTSPNTFLASANCAAFVGATPDFCDIEADTFTLSPVALEAGWKSDTRAVVAVAYAGQSCDMPEIARIARSRDAYVIEDGCHGVGGGFSHGGREWKIGGHPWADITVFSFHPVKTMTTGEGGMLVTDNAEWADRARRLRSHGVARSDFQGLGSTDTALAEQGPWYYEMQDLGWNYRITDFQCALGLSQLARLGDFVGRRRSIVAAYNCAFRDIDWLKIPAVRPEADVNLVSWHLYTLRVDFPALGLSRTDVMNRLREAGVGSQVLYIPVHLQPWYRRTYGYAAGMCPVAESYYREALSLPLYPGMTDEDVVKVIAAVRALD